MQQQKRKVIGLMSGTSCDGVDVALIEISGSGLNTQLRFLHGFHKKYFPRQKQMLLELMYLSTSNVKLISQANFYLAQIWADGVEDILKRSGERRENIALIGSHGQTVYHQPVPEFFVGRKVRSTFQIGDPSVLAQLTGITTIGDFRVADVALGGQGAPLVPYFDWLYFSKLKKDMLSLNIGGIANITYIPADGDVKKVKAFDTGPGNMLIDQGMQRLYQLPFDKNGAKARMGKFSDKLFNYLIKEDTYLHQSPPKSTGREHYGAEFVVKLLGKALRWRIPEPDVMHTITRYSAYTIWQAYKQFIGNKVSLLLIGGGGFHNEFLMGCLQEYFKDVTIGSLSKMGIPEDFKEAICFAVLAYECINGKPVNLPGVTGARRAAILGKICKAELS
jgi:anhydro-N-acetylmuramic acid kinase